MIALYSFVFVAALMSCGLYVGLFVFSPASAEQVEVVEPIIPAQAKSAAAKSPESVPSAVETTPQTQPVPADSVPTVPAPTVAPPMPEPAPTNENANSPTPLDAIEPAEPPMPPETYEPDAGRASGGAPVSPRSTSNPELREARRAIIRDGKEPDWNQYNDAEKAELQKIWNRYQQKGNRKSGGNNKRERNR